MAGKNTSNDILGTIKDIRQTGTKELEKNMSSMLSSTPPKPQPKDPTIAENISQKAGEIANNITKSDASKNTPQVSGNQISVAQEKREKEIIERRRVV